MLRTLFVSVVILTLATNVLFVQHYKTAAIQRSGSGLACVDIPATPDYLSTGSEYDAIAAMNNARQTEHLHSLHLPAGFYHRNPVQQQFVLVNLERSDRGLQLLRMDANLTQMAEGYSKQLRNLQFFSHTSPIGGTFTERIDSNPAIFNHYGMAAENLAGNPVPGVGPM